MRTLWLRLRAAWVTLTGTGAAASVAFGLLVFASVLASLAIPRESVGLSNGALQRVIAASRPADRTVIGTVPETSMTDEIGQVQATDIAAVGASLRARLAAGGMLVASDPPAWASLTTDYVPVTGAAQAAGDGQPQFEMTYRTELARYSQHRGRTAPGRRLGAREAGRGAGGGDHRHRGQVRAEGRRPAERGAGTAGGHGDHPADEPGFRPSGARTPWRPGPR